MTSLTQWLSQLPGPDLAALVSRRPGALQRPQPRTLTELAGRLERGSSMAAILQALPVPAVQLTEAIGALGDAPTRDALAELVGGDREAADRWLAVLTDHGIVWPGPEGTLRYPDALPGLYGSPLGLGPPLRTLLSAATVDQLRRILSALHVPKPPTRRAEVVVVVQQVLSQPEAVRRAVSFAPPAIADELLAWAHEGVATPDDDGYSFDPDAYRARKAAAQWGMERGIVFGSSWSSAWQMPAEVSRALRGPDYRAPFDPVAPEVPTADVDPGEIALQAARAVSQFADLVLALVDRVARTPIPALKSGGLGVREIDRLTKQLGCAEPDLRLALELCAAAGLLVQSGRAWGLGRAAAPWREGSPADRMAALVHRWWSLPSTPGDMLDEDGKRLPVLAPRACHGCVLARQTVVTALADLGEAVAADPAALCRLALWRRPFAHALDQDVHGGDGIIFATHLAEAQSLGIVAAGAVTAIGTAVLTADGAGLRRALTAALPASNDSALFGADLTAVVAGAPSAAVSRLLDATADREGRGGATVWRFSPGSVRRALDGGASADALTADLAAIATGDLPQALRYLIGDIARRHGNLRVSGATSVVRGLDEALLAAVAADRSLRRLGLRRVAPTVLASDADADTVLAALRAAGYLPMPERTPDEVSQQGLAQDSTRRAAAAPSTADGGSPETDRPAADLAAEPRADMLRAIQGDTPRPAPEPLLDADALAARLLAAAPHQEHPQSPTEAQLRQDRALSRALSNDEVRILASAIDSSARVGIDYLSQTESLTHRVISNPQLFGDSIVAWCELRRAERWFRVDRIRSVFQPD